MLKVSVKNYSVYLDLTKSDPCSTLKALTANYFVNRKIKQLQKIKTVSFVKLTTVTVKKSLSMNLNNL